MAPFCCQGALIAYLKTQSCFDQDVLTLNAETAPYQEPGIRFLAKDSNMDRRVILVGDPPSSGGAVLPGEISQATVKGKPYAHIGGLVHCAACNGLGRIAKAGGPYRPLVYGFEMALEGDIVLCKCVVNPTLIAKTIASSLPNVTIDDRIESLGPVPTAVWGSPSEDLSLEAPFVSDLADHSIQFLLLDANSRPLSQVFYSVKLPTGEIVRGTSDGKGFTGRYTSVSAAVFTVYIGQVGFKLPLPLAEEKASANAHHIEAAQSTRLAKPWRLSDQGLGFLKDYESFSDRMYNDATGNATIGYGHLIHYGVVSGASSERPFTNGLSEEEASNLLREELTGYESAINASVHVPLHQKEYDALVIFAFNIGSSGASKSKAIQAINTGLYEIAPDEMMTWNKGRDPRTHQLVEIRGLTNRRADEVKIFKQADYTRTK